MHGSRVVQTTPGALFATQHDMATDCIRAFVHAPQRARPTATAAATSCAGMPLKDGGYTDSILLFLSMPTSRKHPTGRPIWHPASLGFLGPRSRCS
jgi:hypothetical protein